MKKIIAWGALFLLAAPAVLLAMGCVGDESVEESDEEEVAEAEQAIGEGGPCLPPFANCNTGLTCCNEGGGIRKCRALQTDEANCGACGNNCDDTEPPPFFNCWVCSSGTCFPSCPG